MGGTKGIFLFLYLPLSKREVDLLGSLKRGGGEISHEIKKILRGLPASGSHRGTAGHAGFSDILEVSSSIRRRGASSDPRWSRRLIKNFAQEGCFEWLPLGSLPLRGREGVTLTTSTEDFLNNSYIEDFSRAKRL
jgi:hypothetical protein